MKHVDPVFGKLTAVLSQFWNTSRSLDMTSYLESGPEEVQRSSSIGSASCANMRPKRDCLKNQGK